MGFGFPAAIGAKVACPDRPVVDIAGDGSFIMTEQELACSVTENIPVTVIVLNNSVLRHGGAMATNALQTPLHGSQLRQNT